MLFERIVLKVTILLQILPDIYIKYKQQTEKKQDL